MTKAYRRRGMEIDLLAWSIPVDPNRVVHRRYPSQHHHRPLPPLVDKQIDWLVHHVSDDAPRWHHLLRQLYKALRRQQQHPLCVGVKCLTLWETFESIELNCDSKNDSFWNALDSLKQSERIDSTDYARNVPSTCTCQSKDEDRAE